MKAHIGTDTMRGLVNNIVVTNASVHDFQIIDDLLDGEKRWCMEMKHTRMKLRGSNIKNVG